MNNALQKDYDVVVDVDSDGGGMNAQIEMVSIYTN